MECTKHDLDWVKRPGELWLANKKGKCSLVFRYTYEINGPVIGKLTFYIPFKNRIYKDSFFLTFGTFLFDTDQINSPDKKLHRLYQELLYQDNLMAEDLACSVLERYHLKLPLFNITENEKLLH
jgi:hypothetical protein